MIRYGTMECVGNFVPFPARWYANELYVSQFSGA